MKPAHIASTSLYPAMLSSTKPELDCIHAMLKVHQILGKWWISEWCTCGGCTCDQCAMHLFLLGPSFAASCWIFHSFLLKELTHDILSWLIQLQSLSAQEIPYPLGLMSYIRRIEEKMDWAKWTFWFPEIKYHGLNELDKPLQNEVYKLMAENHNQYTLEGRCRFHKKSPLF